MSKTVVNALLARNKCTKKPNALHFQELNLAAVGETFKKR